MTTEQERQLPAWLLVTLIVLAVIGVLAAMFGGSYLAAEGLWWLIDHGGWPRAAVAIVLAAAGGCYVYREHRREPRD